MEIGSLGASQCFDKGGSGDPFFTLDQFLLTDGAVVLSGCSCAFCNEASWTRCTHVITVVALVEALSALDAQDDDDVL